MSAIVWKFEHFLALPFFGIEMKTDLFQVRTVTREARFKPHRQPTPHHIASGESGQGPQEENVARSPQGRVVPAPTGCLQRGAHRVEDSRRLAPPPSGRPETRGGSTGQVSQTTPHRSRRTGPGRTLQRQGPNQAPAGGPKAQTPRATRDPKS